MRSLRHAVTAAILVMVSGCLVSETPVLDVNSGTAKPLKDGAHQICGLTPDGAEEDCEIFALARSEDSAYVFLKEGEDTLEMRFRRIERSGYAVQSAEDGEHVYYYAAGGRRAMTMTMMNCPDLPDDLRARLIAQADLAAENDDFTICVVNTLEGLVAAARAYHRGEAASDEPLRFVVRPAPKPVDPSYTE